MKAILERQRAAKAAAEVEAAADAPLPVVRGLSAMPASSTSAPYPSMIGASPSKRSSSSESSGREGAAPSPTPSDPDALCDSPLWNKACSRSGYCVLGFATIACVALLGTFVAVLIASDVPMLKDHRDKAGCDSWPAGCDP